MLAPIPDGPYNRLNLAVFMLKYGASVALFSRIVFHAGAQPISSNVPIQLE